MTPGLYLVHKPAGPTSFSLVRAFQDEAKNAPDLQFSHGGALDPFAEGLLLVLAGQASRLLDHLHSAPKTYVADLAWGLETDNGDPTGQESFRGDPSTLAPEDLDAALSGFLGWQDQVPPAHSNKKVGGEPAYKKVLRGETVVLAPSKVFLHAARFLGHELPGRSRVELVCRGGYYVRALARDLGRRLGCGAHLASLRRTAIGPWEDPGSGGRVLVRGAALLPWCPSRELLEPELAAIKSGRPIPAGEVRAPDWPVPEGFPDPEGPVRALHRGRLVALLRPARGGLHAFANLRGGV